MSPKDTIATLPPSAHVGIIRRALEEEKKMRNYVFRNNATMRHKKVKEMDDALESLAVIERHIRQP